MMLSTDLSYIIACLPVKLPIISLHRFLLLPLTLLLPFSYFHISWTFFSPSTSFLLNFFLSFSLLFCLFNYTSFISFSWILSSHFFFHHSIWLYSLSWSLSLFSSSPFLPLCEGKVVSDFSECFSDLDEITARYIQPMNDYVQEIGETKHLIIFYFIFPIIYSHFLSTYFHFFNLRTYKFLNVVPVQLCS